MKKYIDDSPFVAEAMLRGIISNPGLAEELQPKIEKDMNKKVKLPAIVMALRRYSEELEKRFKKQHKKKISSEIIVKTGIFVLAIRKSKTLLKKLEAIYALVDYEKGDILNITHGNKEVSVICSEKHRNAALKKLKHEKIFKKEFDLAALTLIFSEEYQHTPGMIFSVVRKLAWHNINIIELVSANIELSVIIKKKDSSKAYELLQDMMN